ncbi:hypothetical protein BGZ93_003465, partial [Podila epicladia]
MRRLDLKLVEAKGLLIQSLENLDPRETPLFIAVAMHCIHLRHLELVVNTRGVPRAAQASSLKRWNWPTLSWTVTEASCAVEAFMKAVARVGEYGKLVKNTHDSEGVKSFSAAPTRRYGMELKSVSVMFGDRDGDFRLLWSLRHLPNLRKLEIQGQWVNRIVSNEPDKMVFWLEDLVVLLERCARIEEVVLSNLQLVSGAENTVDKHCLESRVAGDKHFETLLEAPLDSSTITTPQSPSSSLKSLALPIFPRRIDVYLSLLDIIGQALHDLDLSFVEWNCHLPESTTYMLSLVSACPALRTLVIRFKPNPAREITVLQNLPSFANILDLSLEHEIRSKLHQRQHGQHGLPGMRSCLDFAELATVFPQTLTALTLTDVQIEGTNLLYVDPQHVQGVMHLRILYRP